MCLQCGCGLPYKTWGDPDNLVVDHIKRSVETAKGLGKTTDEAIKEIVETWKKVPDKDKQYKATESPKVGKGLRSVIKGS